MPKYEISNESWDDGLGHFLLNESYLKYVMS